MDELGIKKEPDVPLGVMARQIGQKHLLYLNVIGNCKKQQHLKIWKTNLMNLRKVSEKKLENS